MDEHWFGALHAKTIGKMLQVLKKGVFLFSQFTSLYIVSLYIVSLLSTVFCCPCWECLTLITCTVNVPPSLLKQSFLTEVLTSPGSLVPLPVLLAGCLHTQLDPPYSSYSPNWTHPICIIGI